MAAAIPTAATATPTTIAAIDHTTVVRRDGARVSRKPAIAPTAGWSATIAPFTSPLSRWKMPCRIDGAVR